MTTLKNIITYTFFLFASITSAIGQSGPLADEYTRLAGDFKKNMKPDSAILYYEKAAIEFQALGNNEKFIDSYNQIGIILTRQDNYEKAKTYLDFGFFYFG